MDKLLDMITTDSSPNDISDQIKQILFAKASERVENIRPVVASSLFKVEAEEE